MLAQVIDEAARRFGDSPAYLASNGWALTYRQLASASEEVAAALVHRGVGEGDVVALVLPSIPEYVVAYAAAARIGAITAGVNVRLTPDERAAVLANALPRLIITTDALVPTRDVLRSIDPQPELVLIEPAAGADTMLIGVREFGASVVAIPDDPDRPVAIVFTSGTTGSPKGAVFAGRQLDFITTVDTGRRWGGGAAALAGTSFAHLGPMTKLPGSLHRGGTTVLADHWRAHDALELIAEHRMPVVAGIPTQIALMLRDKSFDEFDLSCVRTVVMGGGPAAPALVREARERFGAPVVVRYACTEAGVGLGTAIDDDPDDAIDTVGRPHAGVELTIADRDGNALETGAVGEVCLRSPGVMTGYWRDPQATRAAFTPQGAVRTGDLGFVDDRGRVHLVGRATDMYVRGGYNVHPNEVEATLIEHPGVADLAIVGRPDTVMGEIGVAFVVATTGAPPPTVEDLCAYAADRLAAYKLPAEVRYVDALPLTPMDKVDRRTLRDMAAPS